MKLNYRQYSKRGEPLLVLHGLFGSLSNWGWHCKKLADDYAVIGVDLRNHGDSPHSGDMSYSDMAADVVELLVALGHKTCSICGHSMGGKVAMEVALGDPGLVNRLVVVDIAPVNYPDKAEGHRRILAAMQELDLQSVRNRAEAEKKLQPDIEDEATLKFILTNLVRNDSGTYTWRLNLNAIESNYDRLREKPASRGPFEKPTLFVRGALSNYVGKRNEAEILELFPNAEVKTVTETGHWLHAEKPEVFQTIVRGFLNRENKSL